MGKGAIAPIRAGRRRTLRGAPLAIQAGGRSGSQGARRICRVLFSAFLSTQGAERRTQLFGKQLRLFPGGEVATLVGLVEVDEVGVNLLGPAARGPEDLAGERGEADREGDRHRSVAGRASGGLPALPVRAGG